MVTQERLKELFDYQDGALIRRKNGRSAVIAMGVKRYERVSVDGKIQALHRMIYLWNHGHLPKTLDHIDGDRMNNRIENLREATSSQNNQNRKATSSSGVKGVVWHKQSKKWIASICVNRKSVHLGSFLSIEDAALVANKARQSAHGEFYRGQA